MGEILRIETGCPGAASLARVAGGSADQHERRVAFRHALNCGGCCEILIALLLAENSGTPEQEALLASALARPIHPAPRRTPAMPLAHSRPHWDFRLA